MLGLLLILAPLLRFRAAVAGDPISLYHRSGHEAVLPCGSVSAADTTCSNINWLYRSIRPQTTTILEVEDGNVEQRSVRAARLSLGTRCSLVVSNITADDAGHYVCRWGPITTRDAQVFLSVLTISPVPPDADPTSHGNVTLACSLFKSYNLGQCGPNSFRWLDEAGAELLDEGVGFKVLTQTNCVSRLTVKHQRGHNRKYRCQYMENQSVRVEADYTSAITDAAADENIYVGAGLLVLLVLGIVTVALVKCKKGTKVTEDLQEPADPSENSVTYMTVRHHNRPGAAESPAIGEEMVTYSAIRAADTETDPSLLYSCSKAQ